VTGRLVAFQPKMNLTYKKNRENLQVVMNGMVTWPIVAVFFVWFLIFHCCYLRLYLHTLFIQFHLHDDDDDDDGRRGGTKQPQSTYALQTGPLYPLESN
jgi:hypothetical protein